MLRVARRQVAVSGHSKWAQIKRAKGANDQKRGQLFTKLGREITVAAREGGPNPDGNARLRMAIDRAREANMPMDTIQRAIQRGTGAGEGAALEEVVYEAYGAGGASLLIEATTDNRNRTVAEVRADPTRLDEVRRALEAAGAQVTSAEVAMVPKTQLELSVDQTTAVIRLV